MISLLKRLGMLLVMIALAPIMIVVFLLFLALWLVLTLTGVGPAIQWYFSTQDAKLLNINEIIRSNSDIHILHVPNGVNSACKSDSYNLVYRFSCPPDACKGIICIPNGLGATMVTIGQIHEKLVEAGFCVLSFDRYGVGFSDCNPSNRFPTAEDVVRECDYVMEKVAPNRNDWILLGPSMGSIVAQCYIATFPHKVKGFLNMDGLPYPFISHKNSFLSAGKLYSIYAYIIWTGIFRPFISMSFKSMLPLFKCNAFPPATALAQVNEAKFFSNIAIEMNTMMDCCEFASKAWGKFSVSALNEDNFSTLCRAKPNESLRSEEGGPLVSTDIRSVSERGDSWACDEDVHSLVQRWKKNPADVIKISSVEWDAHSAESALVANPIGENYTGELCSIWSKLVVSVMSGRNHDFGSPMANSFYTSRMKDEAAAEHAQHVLFAKAGFRTVYPEISHSHIFGQSQEIVRHAEMIVDLSRSSDEINLSS